MMNGTILIIMVKIIKYDVMVQCAGIQIGLCECALYHTVNTHPIIQQIWPTHQNNNNSKCAYDR